MSDELPEWVIPLAAGGGGLLLLCSLETAQAREHKATVGLALPPRWVASGHLGDFKKAMPAEVVSPSAAFAGGGELPQQSELDAFRCSNCGCLRVSFSVLSQEASNPEPG